jgi:predicted  nucleic acid-binding Zn-ribbon protein
MLSNFEHRKLTEQEFELEAQIKSYMEQGDEGSAEYCREQQKALQYKLYGWRSMSRDRAEKEVLDDLRRKVLRLQNQKIEYENLLASYPKQVKDLEKRIKELQGYLGNDTGYNPDPKEIEKVQEELIDLLGDVEIAKERLPMVEKRLEEARTELKKAEGEISLSKIRLKDKKFINPSEELDYRAKEYARQQKITYDSAASRILESDPVLAYAYQFGIF